MIVAKDVGEPLLSAPLRKVRLNLLVIGSQARVSRSVR